MTFNVIVDTDDLLAAPAMQNWRHPGIGYGADIFPALSANGAGTDNALNLGTSTYRWATIYGVSEILRDGTLRVLKDDAGTDRGVILSTDLANNGGLIDTPNATTNLLFAINGVNKMILNASTGFLGIGNVTSPATTLHVSSPGSTIFTIERTAGHINTMALIISGGGDIAANSGFIGLGTAADLNFKSDPALIGITLKASQRLGIGTGAPAAPVHMYSGAGQASAVATSHLIIENSGNAYISINAGAASFAGLIFPVGADNDNTFLDYKVDTGVMRLVVNTNSILTISNTGNTGFDGTPHFKVDVNGDIRIQGANKLYFGGTGAADNDTNLYRPSANILKTDDAFTAAGTITQETASFATSLSPTTTSFFHFTQTVISWDSPAGTAKEYNYDSLFDIGSPTRITAQTAGIYSFDLMIAIDAGTPTAMIYFVCTYTINGIAQGAFIYDTSQGLTIGDNYFHGHLQLDLAASDYVKIIVEIRNADNKDGTILGATKLSVKRLI